MNVNKINQYIAQYKDKFDDINKIEIYKWQAVRQFQNNFDIGSPRFSEMLATSLSKTYNLMDSGNYFPRKMILRNAERTPGEIRALFAELYNQETDKISRITNFQMKIRKINQKNFSIDGLKDYQDHRAIIVYLNLRYPNDNYFYKFRMFKDLAAKINYEYTPKIGDLSNISQFYTVCDVIKELLLKDNEVIQLHKSRIGNEEYFDTSFNILTQDFIFAVSYHLNSIDTKKGISTVNLIPDPVFISGDKISSFRARFDDYAEREKRNKIIGILGELFILQYEMQRCQKRPSKLVTHVSKSIGDGLGYDIMSYDNEGNKKYIEVKTTKGDLNTPFYITRNELEKSKIEKDSYYLYRVFNFDEKNNTADLKIIQGDLTEYCSLPTQFKVQLIMGNKP